MRFSRALTFAAEAAMKNVIRGKNSAPNQPIITSQFDDINVTSTPAQQTLHKSFRHLVKASKDPLFPHLNALIRH